MKKFLFEKQENQPIYISLADAIKREILDSRLMPGEKLPSKRDLSIQLGVSQNTVMSAYSWLQSRGYILAKPRQGYFVSHSLRIENTDDLTPKDDIEYTFSANGNALFNNPAPFTKITHKMLKDINKNMFTYTDTLGSPDLRYAITSHLYQEKDIRCDAEHIIIGAGFAYILDVVIKVLGTDKVYAIENPCYGRAMRALEENNCDIRYLNPNKDGFKVDELISSGADVLFCMSHHQYPLGYTMTDEHKTELLKWLDEGDRYIIEFDYDSDFLYSEKYSSTLLSMAKCERVIQIGNFQRNISPGISLSYAVLPHKIKHELKEKIPFFNCLSSNIDMALVTELIQHGNLKSNIKMLKKTYIQKHDFVIEEFDKLKSKKNLNIFGDTGGSFFCIEYTGEKDFSEICGLLDKNSIKILPLSVFCRAKNPNIPENTFIFGFGEHDLPILSEGIKRFDSIFM